MESKKVLSCIEVVRNRASATETLDKNFALLSHGDFAPLCKSIEDALNNFDFETAQQSVSQMIAMVTD